MIGGRLRSDRIVRDVDVVVAFNKAINTADLAALSGLMADNHRFVDSTGSVTSGKTACTAAWRGFFAAFPDYRNCFHSITDEGDGRVIAEGHSECSAAVLDGPAIWTAHVVDGFVTEWRVDDPR